MKKRLPDFHHFGVPKMYVNDFYNASSTQYRGFRFLYDMIKYEARTEGGKYKMSILEEKESTIL